MASQFVVQAKQAPESGHPVPRVIVLDAAGKDYLRVLGGPPQTSTMRSGLVVLAPGSSVGKHSTDQYEELLIVLRGQGEMRIEEGDTLRLRANVAAYCPPFTTHNVANTGQDTLSYVYVVAEARAR